MEREFVSYEQSVALKELGFNERTFYAFYKDSGILLAIGSGNLYDTPAPLKQQVFRWFRDKFNLYTDIYPLDITVSGKTGYRYSYVTYHLIEAYANNDDELLGHYTYEEAEDACIDKLIELAKQQSK